MSRKNSETLEIEQARLLTNKLKWPEHEKNEKGTKPNNEYIKAVLKLKARNLPKSYHRSWFHKPNFFEIKGSTRKILKKGKSWKWKTDPEKDFNQTNRCLLKDHV